MKYFHYTGRRGNGLTVQGWLLAENRDDALSTLRGWQVQPLLVKPGPGHIPLRVPEEELLATLRELASLRGSGMPLDQAVDAVVHSTEHRGLLRAWRQVSRMLRSGLSLSDAMASAPDAFPRYAVPLVRVGEANGELRSALASVAERLEEEMNLSAEIKTALTYPAFLLVISAAVLIFLFLVVIPKFGSMIGDMGQGAPTAIGALVSVADVMREYLWLWGGGLIVLILWGAQAWRSGGLQAWLWSWMQRMPGVRGVLQAWEIVQFCGSMRRLLPEGVGILEAVQLSSETLGRDDMLRRLQAAADRMRQGESLAAALESQQVFPPLVTQMIAVGEEAASLPDAMREITRLYERRMREGIRRFLSLLEPMVIVTMGMLVGGIMVALLSAIMSMNDLPI